MIEQNYETLRRAMVSNQLRTAAVNDARVVAAMGAIPRERHVPPESALLAYLDRPVMLGNGRALNPPMATGRLLTEAHPVPSDHALIVGAATGYSAALLAELVTSIVALDEDADLLAQAKQASASARINFVKGPLVKGWAKAAPYDLILIDGAVDYVPQPLIDQLADGGRVAVAIADRGVTRLAIGRKAGKGFGLNAFADCEAVVLPGFARPKSFSF